MSDLPQRRAQLSDEQRTRLQARLRGNTNTPAVPGIPRQTVRERAPLSFAQQRQWFLWQLDRNSTAYHLSGGLVLRGPLDVPALQAAIQALVVRHDALRTVFRTAEDGSAEQIILPVAALVLPCVELVDLPAGQRAARMQAETGLLCLTPFDLAAGPLMRVQLLHTAAQEYRLLVVMHHIISDGWSVQLILDELAALYRSPGNAGLASLPVQYLDYAVWQREWLAGAEGERQLAWWRAQLGTEQPVLTLPTDHPRRADGRYQAAQYEVILPAAVVGPLRQHSQAQGGTLFGALLTAFQVLLYRHSGQADIRVGLPVANRNRAETAGVVGFFVNTQVLRAQVAAHTTLASLWAQTRDAAVGVQLHQDLPFERLVEALQSERSLSTHPLFQVMFNHLRRDHRSLAQWPGVAVERIDFAGQSAQFELTLQTCEDDSGQVTATFLYAQELFDAATVQRWMGHYLGILEALANQPQQSVRDLPLLGADELAQLQRWSVNSARYDAVVPVHQLFERQAVLQPDVAALVSGSVRLSYAELNARANQLAHRLMALGVKAESRVGIAVERSVEMVVGLLAILKAGGAYVPLDPDYPAERLSYMLADSGISLLLTQSGLDLPQSAVPVLLLDTLDVSGELASNPDVVLSNENLAYVIYTSGSTGKPKGAANRHSALFNRLAWMQDAYQLTSEDTVLQKTPFSFDVSVWEFFWPLMTGAKLAIANPGDHRDPARLVELIQQHEVTTLHFVPSMLQAFLAHDGIEVCAGLKRIVCSGEALPAEAQYEVFKRLPNAALYNLYGPTEAAIDVTHWTCVDNGQNQVPIGAPIADTQTYVLDEALNLAPQGVAGELYLGGAGLARGYLDRPSLTAERFIADPFGTGGRLYRTGDLVRWNKEGQLDYLGRIDHQVKIRGFRIELGEIEAQLLAQAHVREAVVVAQQGPGGARLLAYISAQSQQPIDTAHLREQISQHLPDYMVPSTLIVLPTLPLNANGKVDRKALPEPDFSASVFEAPQGKTETTLAAIWADLLGVPQISRQHNFFALGGDSILSLKLVARARQHNLAITPRLVFEQQALASLAAALDHASATPGIEPIPALPVATRQLPLPLSHAQARQWFLWQLEPLSTAYHIAGALRLQGMLDVQALQASFDALIQRHEALRTVFRAGVEGMAEQVILPASRLPIQYHDARGTDAAAITTRLSATPFDLTSGPLLRVGLIQTAADTHLLVLVMHHIIADGWSLQVIVKEFAALYAAGGQAASLPPLPIQYADYAHWHRHWLANGEQQRQLAWWQNQLGAAQPILQLPTDHPRNAKGEYRAASLGITLPAAPTRALQQRAQASGATLFMLLLAGFQGWLQRNTGLSDIRVGVPIANRERAGTEGVVGFFVNTQVLRSVLAPRASLASVLDQARAAAIGAQAHQDLPFEQLVEALQPERSLGTSPLFQVLFNHNRGDVRNLAQLPGLSLHSHALAEQAAQFELTLNTTEHGDGTLHIEFSYAAELFDTATVQRWQQQYLALLNAMVATPEQALADVPLLSAQDRQLLQNWGVNPGTYPATHTLPRLIERQVLARPDAPALVAGDITLSYATLNRRANQLAHCLIAHGVGPETRVGVALPRSADLFVALLAISKTGAAYVPLDPTYPAERLAYMLQDSGVSLLLANAPSALPVRTLHLAQIDLSASPGHNPGVVYAPEHLAYVIYTSGSTGQPKGVAVSHGALLAQVQAVAAIYGLNPADRVLHFASINFDAAAEQWLAPWLSGAAVVLVDPQAHTLAQLGQLIAQTGVTVLDVPPAYLRQLAAALSGQTLPLRLCILGGEAWSFDDYQLAQQTLGAPQVFNAYGPTEAVISPVVWQVLAPARSSAYMPIGRPVGQRSAYVLDADLNLVAPGVVGELYLGGALLARGYLGRAALTADRFIADPLGSVPGARLYRTGDLARWNADGQLEYLGRADHQMKIRGFRVEPGEVEAQLLAQPGVQAAVVVADAGRLLAYVVGNGVGNGVRNGVRNVKGLRAQLAQHLPDYMVPAVIIALAQLPLNANGKVDRKALPAPDAPVDDYIAPQGELETTLAALWADVLGVEKIGRSAHFFELGGHSLLALQLLERVRAHGWAAPVRALFQHPQLAAFAAAISQLSPDEIAVPPNAIPAACLHITPAMLPLVQLSAGQIGQIIASVPGGASNVQDIYPLAPLQAGILFHHLLQTEGDAYVMPQLLAFDSRSHLEAFCAHLNQVIARHDILRTAIVWQDLPEPVQVVYRQAPVQLQWLDAGPAAAARLAAHVNHRHYRINVQRAPLIHAVAVQDGARWLLQVPSHHLVADHTTLDLLVAEIQLMQHGRMADLPVPVPFRNFVAQARLGVSQTEHEAFFSQMLADVDEPTAPFNLLDILGNGSQIAEARSAVPTALAQQLRQQAQRHGVSAATICHLAWGLVLSRSTGKSDVVTGTVLFGRMQAGAGAERALGLFINTLPLRLKLGRGSVVACLRQTHTALSQLLQHEHASLALAQGCSGLPGGTPLFSALLNYRYAAQAQPDKAWAGATVLGSSERTNYPLSLAVDDLGDGFALTAHVAQPVAAERVCAYMLAALQHVVAALAGHAEQPMANSSVLGLPELQQLQRWSVNDVRYDAVVPVQQLFERQVVLQPEAAALVSGSVRLSYAGLNARANRLAHRLMALGVKPESKVGIAVERSVEMVVGLLAILKAGGAYVPLDPEYPAERLSYMLADSGISLLLTQSGLDLPQSAVPVLLLDTLDVSAEKVTNPDVMLSPENLAYVIYTSGSTGKPKGAANRHSALFNRLAWMQDAYELTPEDTVLQKTPFSFDVSVWEFFWPLITGAKLAVANPGDHRDPARLVELIQQYEVTTLHFVPSMLQAFLAHDGIEVCAGLKRIVCSGEALPAEAQYEVFKRLPNAALYNLYGPTEAAIDVTHWTCVDNGQNQVPIGAPIADTQTYVLDEALNLAPQGVAGELYLGGAGLARGYLDRPSLTAERFIADPFGNGGRLYRTGDLVRWNADGQLDYLGRIDHQVKIRGFRIELGEIEAQLLAQPDVREAVVVATNGGARLVAYVSAQPGTELDIEAIRAGIAKNLTDYMVPSAMVVLPGLPLNPNGKVDRKALPEPGFSSKAYQAPQGETEIMLAAIWADVLGVEQVGRTDHFFELGGHSLAALQIQMQIERRCAVRLPLRVLFTHPQFTEMGVQIAMEMQSAGNNTQLEQMNALLAALEA